jgi:hypothetical protein
VKKFTARIVINDQCNDGDYSKAFLLMMHKMGALISVVIEAYADLESNQVSIVHLHLEEPSDMKIFRKL